MDILWFLRQRLTFTNEFYDEASAPFREKMRKIEAEEEPFLDTRDGFYQDVSEPAFLEEYLDAKKAVEMLGFSCLLIVHASLQTYLKEEVAQRLRMRGDSGDIATKLNATGGKNWFDKYRLLFLAEFGVDWKTGPTNLSDIEQINLTRDDLIHNVEVATTDVYRTKNHSERFPNGLFTDDIWESLGIGSKIKIEREQLSKAIEIVEQFCTWLATQPS